jgi:hypothetical protein
LFRRWLIVDVLMFAIVFSFAAQICMFSVASKQSFIGVVYGANGPVAGAVVSASGTQGSGSAVTDGSGHYSISQGLKTGTYDVSAFAIGYLTSQTVNVQVTVGHTTQGISFDLQLSGGVSGTVTDLNSGNPLSGITVVAFSTGGGGSYGWSAITGSDGKYLLATNLPTGSYNVTVSLPEGHISQSSTQTVTAGAEVKNVNFPLAKSGIISGTVTTPGGTPLNGITVYASSTTGGYYGYTTTNATGDYRISSGLGTGSYTVMAINGSSYDQKQASVTAGQETSGVNMKLTVTPPAPSGIITGQVTDTSTGKPVASATVTATGPGGQGSAKTDSNGDYVISSGLNSGTYNVTATAPGYQDQVKTGVSVTVNLTTSNVNLQISKIPPAQSGTITGTVTGAPNPIPEFQYPIAVALSLTLVAAAAGKLFLRTKRFKNTSNLN